MSTPRGDGTYQPWMQAYLDEYGGAFLDELERREMDGAPNRHVDLGRGWVASLTGLGSNRAARLKSYVNANRDSLHRRPVMQSGLQRETPRHVDEPIEDLLDRCEDHFSRKWARRDREVVVTVRERSPFGVLVLGDPHLGDDGCDIRLLRQHVELIQSTPGMYGACVGDWRNNWVGRLVEQYAHQSTTRGDTIRLVEWLMSSVQWAWVIMGNHDHWNNGAELWSYLLRECRHEASGQYDVKLRLETPGQDPIRIWCRHDFKGSSMYHKVQGQLRAVRESDYPADVLIAGHRHTWEEHRTERAGRVITMAQVGSYKRADDYAAQLQFEPDDHGQAYLLILDPWASGMSRVYGTFDLGRGLDLLRMLRQDGNEARDYIEKG